MNTWKHQQKMFGEAWAAGFLLIGCVLLPGCGNVEQAGIQARMEPTSVDGASGMEAPFFQPPAVEFNTESYDSIEENDFSVALDEPQSTFSIDVDTASYANVRRILSAGSVPPAGAVRIEELINYFDYQYPEPERSQPFSVTTELAACPWNQTHQLLRIGLQGRSIDFSERRPCNLVFLLDVSGSMQAANKLPLVQSAMKLLINELQPQDRIAIVTYAGASGVALDSTPISDASRILRALDSLQAGGGTNGAAGIHLAYQVAEEHFFPQGVNRVILCTDGDFNLGTTSDSALVNLIQQKAQTGIEVSVLGFGTGNLKESKMEKIADKGNGNFAYIDSMFEAEKVLVREVGATLVTIAKDVKIQVDFNPLHIQAYRLLGYENRKLQNQDFRDDTKDAGEIGAGHSVTALYELIPAEPQGQSPANIRSSEFVSKTIDPLGDMGTLLTVNLRYKLPESNHSQEFQVRIDQDKTMDSGAGSSDMQFASAVAAYGMLLRGSKYSGTADWDWVIDAASNNLGNDRDGLRVEFVQLARIAAGLSR